MEAEEPGARLIRALSEAVELLRAEGEPGAVRWAEALETQRKRLLLRDGGATIVLLTYYGGAGGLNDVVLTGDAGRRFSEAVNAIYEESRKLGRELDLL